jgi:hypothetical protein
MMREASKDIGSSYLRGGLIGVEAQKLWSVSGSGLTGK